MQTEETRNNPTVVIPEEDVPAVQKEGGFGQTFSDLIALGRANPIRWMVPDIVMEGGTHILHGRESSFKTMLTLQLLEALTIGGKFLLDDIAGGLRTGIAQLEQKPRLFAVRLDNFFPNHETVPPIFALPEHDRFKLLNSNRPKDKITIIVEWAERNKLDFIAIDSAVKLFPPGYDLSRTDLASEVFSQLQRLPTAWILAHDRKSRPDEEQQKQTGANAEIVGSGRFAQDPDIICSMVRSDRRVPMAVFDSGKSREGEPFDPIEIWFDKIDFRLYPIHPLIHLLREGPRLESELITEAERRYGKKDRTTRLYIAGLLKLQDASGNPAFVSEMTGHNKSILMTGEPVPTESA